MNVIKCTKCNLHYDVDKYSTCPHCKGGVGSQSEKKSDTEIIKKSDTDNTRKSIRDRFSKKEKSNNDNIDSKTLSAYSAGYFNSDDSSDNSEKSYDGSNKTTDDVVKDTDVSKKFLEKEEKQVDPEIEEDFEERAVSSDNSLTEEIDKITKNNTGRTLSYFSLGNSDESTKSDSNNVQKEIPNKIQSGPVVGWLVCTKGKHMGESFQLVDGNNSIGRGDSNDVVLFREPGVSSNKHAIITYNPRKRVFFVTAGDSHGVTYLNDDMVLGSQEIKIYDLIELGESAGFIFIPLCGEQFSWEEYIGR